MNGIDLMQRDWICSSLLGSESNWGWGNKPSLWRWLWLRKLSQVKVPSQSQAALQTWFITSSSVGFLPEEQRTYPTSLHWIASSGWKNSWNHLTNRSIILKIELLSFFQGLEAIQCKEVGYVLRSLGQNPTEDEVINLVCEAGCDWEGTFTCDDFLKVAVNSLQKQVNRLDDVRAAFRYVILLYSLYMCQLG